MRTLTIRAASLESARGLYGALAAFNAKLTEDEYGNYQVEVALARSAQVTLSILTAIEQHVTLQDGAAARIQMDGKSYTMHAASALM